MVYGKRIPRTRARFDCPWLVVGVADVEEERVDKAQLKAWLPVGGRRHATRRLRQWLCRKDKVRISEDVEHRFRTKLNTDSGKLNSDSGKLNSDSGS